MIPVLYQQYNLSLISSKNHLVSKNYIQTKNTINLKYFIGFVYDIINIL